MSEYSATSENNHQQNERAGYLSKWLSLLFWLIIPGTIAGLMGSNIFMTSAPGLYMAGQILNALCTAASGFIFLKLSREEDHYHIAAICAFVAAGASLLASIISGAAETPNWTLFITIPAAIVALTGTSHEFKAHSSILFNVDHALSEKWDFLWKWYIGTFIGMIGSVLLILIVPILGLLVFIIAAIAFIIVSIIRLVTLYNTAHDFKLLSMAPQSEG